MLTRGDLKLIKQSPSDFYCNEVHDAHDESCDNKKGEAPPDVGMVNW